MSTAIQKIVNRLRGGRGPIRHLFPGIAAQHEDVHARVAFGPVFHAANVMVEPTKFPGLQVHHDLLAEILVTNHRSVHAVSPGSPHQSFGASRGRVRGAIDFQEILHRSFLK